MCIFSLSATVEVNLCDPITSSSDTPQPQQPIFLSQLSLSFVTLLRVIRGVAFRGPPSSLLLVYVKQKMSPSLRAFERRRANAIQKTRGALTPRVAHLSLFAES